MPDIARWVERIEVGILAAAAAGPCRLPLSLLHRLGAILGRIAWHVLPARRRASIGRIERHLPDRAPNRRAAAALAHASWLETGRSFLEVFHIRAFGVAKLGASVRVPDSDKETLARFIATERPVVVAGAHIGSWALLLGLLGTVFADARPRAMLVRKQRHLDLAEVALRRRMTPGIQLLDKKESSPGVRAILEQNGLVALFADVNTSSEAAVFLPFLGEPAAISKGFALLALESKALVWPMFLVRDPGNGRTHTLHINEPLDAGALSGSIEERASALCLFVTRAIEKVVLAYPTQWYWLPNRWKTRPGMGDVVVENGPAANKVGRTADRKEE